MFIHSIYRNALVFLLWGILNATEAAERPGAVDRSFNAGSGGDGPTKCVAAQIDGRILCGGTFKSFSGVNSTHLVRLFEDGSVDLEFSTNWENSASAISIQSVNAIHVQPDGTILVGFSLLPATGSGLGLIRLSSNGALDTDWNPEPIPPTDGQPSLIHNVFQIIPQSEDRILIATSPTNSTFDDRAMLSRLKRNGTFDDTFSLFGGRFWAAAALAGDRTVIKLAQQIRILDVKGNPDVPPFEFTSFGPILATTPQGAILVDTLITPREGGLLRLSSQLTRDDSWVITPLNRPLTAIAVQNDGSVLVTGKFSRVSDQPSSALIRLTADGEWDRSFSADPELNGITALSLERTDRILSIGGFQSIDGLNAPGIARIIADPPHPYPPFIYRPSFSTNLIIPRWTPFRINMAIAGWPVPNLQWERDGRPIEGQTNSTLVIDFPTAQESGLYVLHAQNDIGSESSLPVRLTVVEDRPVFTVSPTNSTIEAGTTYTNSAATLAFPDASYQWLWNGYPIAGETGAVIIQSEVFTTNSGFFSVIASNSFGSVTSQIAQLTVLPQRVFPGATDLEFNVRGQIGFFQKVPTPFFMGVERAEFNNDGSLLLLKSGFMGLSRGSLIDTNFTLKTNGVLSRVDDFRRSLDDRILVLGTSFVSGHRDSIVRFFSNGMPDSTFHFQSEWLYRINDWKVDPAGTVWIVAQTNSTPVGQPSSIVFQLKEDGSLGFQPSLNGLVKAAATEILNFDHGAVLLKGVFRRNGASSDEPVIRLLADGTLDNGFATPFESTKPISKMISLPDHKWMVLGESRIFSNSTGILTPEIYRLESNGAMDPSFQSEMQLDFAQIQDLTVDSAGQVYVAGIFQQIHVSPPRSAQVIRLLPDGGVDHEFVGTWRASDRYELADHISALPDGKLFIYGNNNRFAFANEQRRFGCAILHNLPESAPVIVASPTNMTVSAGSRLSLRAKVAVIPTCSLLWTFNSETIPGANQSTLTLESALVSQAGTYRLVASNALGIATQVIAQVVVTPAPHALGGINPHFTSKLSADLSLDDIQPLAGGQFIVGGSFRSWEGTARSSVAVINQEGQLDSTFSVPLSTNRFGLLQVRRIAVQSDHKIILAGSFRYAGNPAYEDLIRIRPDGSLDDSFNASSWLLQRYPTRYSFAALKLDSKDRLLVAGTFAQGFTPPYHGLLRLLSNGLPDPTFFPPEFINGANGLTVAALLIQPGDGKIIIGGTFERDGKRLLRLNEDGTTDTTFVGAELTWSGYGFCELVPGGSPVAAPIIRALAMDSQNRVLVAGGFSQWNGHDCYNLARLKPGGNFDPTLDSRSLYGQLGSVNTMCMLEDESLVIASCEGQLFEISPDGESRSTVTVTQALVSSPGQPWPVHSLLATGPRQVIVCGHFTGVGTSPRPAIAQISTSLILEKTKLSRSRLQGRLATVEGGLYTLESTSTLDSGNWNEVTRLIGSGDWMDLDVVLPESRSEDRYFRLRMD